MCVILELILSRKPKLIELSTITSRKNTILLKKSNFLGILLLVVRQRQCYYKLIVTAATISGFTVLTLSTKSKFQHLLVYQAGIV